MIQGEARFPGDADDVDVQTVREELDKLLNHPIRLWEPERAERIGVLSRWLADVARDKGAMDDVTREAVQAYYRLQKALGAVVSDPAERLRATDHTPALQALAWEANAAMKKAGLLDVPPERVFALVRQIHPDFETKG